jgi:hypothetical protein
MPWHNNKLLLVLVGLLILFGSYFDTLFALNIRTLTIKTDLFILLTGGLFYKLLDVLVGFAENYLVFFQPALGVVFHFIAFLRANYTTWVQLFTSQFFRAYGCCGWY